MAVEILMPEIGESVHEGTVSRWLKKEGDFVKEDEPVVEIMTDKVNTELPSPATGILSKILIPEGSQVEVFKAMGLIEEQSAAATPHAVGAIKPAQPSAARSDSPAKPIEPPPAAAEKLNEPNSATGVRRYYTPVVRSMAKKLGIADRELSAVPGSGDGGRVTKRDLEAFVAAKPSTGKSAASRLQVGVDPKPAPVAVPGADTEQFQLAGMRKMIADAMLRSAAVPTVTTVMQVDVSSMVRFREASKEAFLETYGVKLTYTPFFMKALTDALIEYPLLNASLQGDHVVMNKAVNMGIAVALGAKGDEGLIVPVIRDCQKKTVVDIARDLESIAKAARSNALKPADVQGGTFTLTNPGTYGALFGTPMIVAPQAGIAGAYGIHKMPIIVDDMIAIRSVMHLVLTYDHRIIDGLLAGKFLADVRDRLEKFDFFK